MLSGKLHEPYPGDRKLEAAVGVVRLRIGGNSAEAWTTDGQRDESGGGQRTRRGREGYSIAVSVGTV